MMDISCAVNARKIVLHFHAKEILSRQVFSRKQLELLTGVETIKPVSCWGSLIDKLKLSGWCPPCNQDLRLCLQKEEAIDLVNIGKEGYATLQESLLELLSMTLCL